MTIDEMKSTYFLTRVNQHWPSACLNTIRIVMVFVPGCCYVALSISPSIAGPALAYILTTVQTLQFTVRQLAEVESHMNVVEQLNYHAMQLEMEEMEDVSAQHDALSKLSPAWAEAGKITFANMHMWHHPRLPLLLRGLDLEICAAKHIAFIGMHWRQQI